MGEVQKTRIRAGLVIVLACVAILGVAGTAAAHDHGCVVATHWPVMIHNSTPVYGSTCVGPWMSEANCTLRVLGNPIIC